jgi:hypothetical protein
VLISCASPFLSSEPGGSKRNSIIGGKSRGKTTLKKKQTTKSTSEYKMQVGDYFCVQLSLMADLCLDRNYVAMRFVEERFSFELLLTILKNPTSTSKIKAPVCKLIRCLFIDRDPQIEIKYPRLIRTSLSDLGDEAASPTKIQFFLLQEIISDYLHSDLDLRHCDELSSEMLDLLLALMKFGFFSSEAQLQDVVVPVIHLLDQHRAQDSALTSAGPNSSRGDLHPLSHLSSDSLPEQPEQQQQSWGIASLFHNAPLETKSRSSVQPFPVAVESAIEIRTPEEVVNLGEGHSQTAIPLPWSLWDPSQQRRWCQHLLERLESTSAIVCVLVLVCVSTAIAIMNLNPGRLGAEDLGILLVVDLAISVMFVFELLVRALCTLIVDRELVSFLTNRYKLLDLIVVGFLPKRLASFLPSPHPPQVVLDISMLCYGAVSASSRLTDISRFAKTLRSGIESSSSSLLIPSSFSNEVGSCEDCA